MPAVSDSMLPGAVEAWQCRTCCWIKSCCNHKSLNFRNRGQFVQFWNQSKDTYHINKGWARGSFLSISFLISEEGPWMKKNKSINYPQQVDGLSGSLKSHLPVSKRYLSSAFDQQDVVQGLLQSLVVLYLSHKITRWPKRQIPKNILGCWRLDWPIPLDWTPESGGQAGQQWKDTAQRWCFCARSEVQPCTWPPAGRPPGEKHFTKICKSSRALKHFLPCWNVRSALQDLRHPPSHSPTLHYSSFNTAGVIAVGSASNTPEAETRGK